MFNFERKTIHAAKQATEAEVFEPTRLELKTATSVADEVSLSWRESMNHPKEKVGRLRAHVIQGTYVG